MKKIKIKPTKELFISLTFLVIILLTMVVNCLKITKDVYQNKEISRKSIEDITQGRVFGKIKYIELYGFFNKIIDNNIISGEDKVVKLKNGHLAFLTDKDEHVEKEASDIVDFKNYLNEKQIGFLYVQLPTKISKYDPQLPTGVEDFYNENVDTIVEELRNEKVNTIDLREEIQEEQLNHYDLFFRSDHHWKPETGLWVANTISKKLNEDYKFNIDLEKMDLANYNVEVKEKWFLGSLGKKVSLGYVGPDDIDILTPKFETQFSINIPQGNIKKEGNFAETLLNYKAIEEKDYYNKDPYIVYLYGEKPFKQIENKNTTSKKRVLVIGNSFSRSVIPFLATDIKYVDGIDLRYYKDSVKEYIQKTKPDVVIMMCNAANEKEKFFEIK